MNRNPKMTAIIPIIIDVRGMILLIGFVIVAPMNTADSPKKSRLKPTISETNAEENIGNIIKINPRIIDIKPRSLFALIVFTSI